MSIGSCANGIVLGVFMIFYGDPGEILLGGSAHFHIKARLQRCRRGGVDTESALIDRIKHRVGDEVHHPFRSLDMADDERRVKGSGEYAHHAVEGPEGAVALDGGDVLCPSFPRRP